MEKIRKEKDKNFSTLRKARFAGEKRERGYRKKRYLLFLRRKGVFLGKERRGSRFSPLLSWGKKKQSQEGSFNKGAPYTTIEKRRKQKDVLILGKSSSGLGYPTWGSPREKGGDLSHWKKGGKGGSLIT